MQSITKTTVEAHPMAEALKNGVPDIDLSNVRFVFKKREGYQERVENLLLMSQFMLAHSLSTIVNCFFRKSLRYIKGIDVIDFGNKRRSLLPPGYWDLKMIGYIDDINDNGTDTQNRGKKTDEATPISKECAQRGSYLCSAVQLSHAGEPIEVSNEFDTSSSDAKRHRVRAFPTMTVFMEKLNKLYGILGEVLAKLPDLRRVYVDKFTNAFIIGISTSENTFLHAEALPNPGTLYSFLNMHPIYQNNDGLVIAHECFRTYQSAHDESTRIDKQMDLVQSYFDRIIALQPEVISKQLERSLVLPKLRSFMDNHIAIDDIGNSLVREKGRLSALKKAMESLSSIVEAISLISDMKEVSGIVKSYRIIVTQLLQIRKNQCKKLLGRLPATFLTRTKQFVEFISKMEHSFEVREPGLKGLTVVMRKVQNFDLAKEMLDLETDVCMTLHKVIHTLSDMDIVQDNNDPNSRSSQLQLSEIQIKVNALRAVDEMNRQTLECSERLQSVVARSRAMLLRQLAKMKNDIIEERAGLKQQLKEEKNYLMDSRFNNAEELPGIISAELVGHKTEFYALQKRVHENVAIQALLVEGHDIVGAAEPVLLPNQVDHFDDMLKIEKLYLAVNSVWSTVLKARSALKSLLSSQVNHCDVEGLLKQQQEIFSVYNMIRESDILHAPLSLIQKNLDDLVPTVQMACLISSSVLKTRHWSRLNELVFKSCHLQLHLRGEIITVLDMSKQGTIETSNLGNIGRVKLSTLVDRQVVNHLETMKTVTADALVESTIEDTFDAVDRVLETCPIKLSNDWLRSSATREKVLFDLNRVVNVKQIILVVQMCLKTVLVLENTAKDMGVTIFDQRVNRKKELLQNIERFMTNINEIQISWMRCLELVYFCTQGEVSKENISLFQSCTSEIKRIESIIFDNSCNLAASYNKAMDFNISTDKLIVQLSCVLDDVDSNIQSLVEACPRLSMLSYNKLADLIRAWLLNPDEHKKLISECVNDCFDSVGELIIDVLPGLNRTYFCVGFHSFDNIEVVRFDDPVKLTASLEDFFSNFEMQVRKTLSACCDTLMLNRTVSLRSLLAGKSTKVVLESFKDLFSQRLVQITTKASNEKPNQCMIMVNLIAFAEDVWLGLGYSNETFSMCRPDLILSNIAHVWRENLSRMLEVCQVNIDSIRKILSDSRDNLRQNEKLSLKKATALYSALLYQEVEFVQILYNLLRNHCLESARDYWSTRYQLRFQYAKSTRDRYSPVEIKLGCLQLPHGLEYQGGYIHLMYGEDFENCLQKVVNASFTQRGSCFVCQEDEESSGKEMEGVCGISCADIARALGRPLTTLVSIQHSNAARLFLSRLVYLGAIGAVDLMHINDTGLQILIMNATQVWTALAKNDDFFLLDSMKLPMKHAPCRNDIHVNRRRHNINMLRESFKGKSIGRASIMLIGMASETYHDSLPTFEYVTRSIFDVISLKNHPFLFNLGVALVARGYVYGVELERVCNLVIPMLTQSQKSNRFHLKLRQELLDRAAAALDFEQRHAPKYTQRWKGVYAMMNRLIIEIACFFHLLWEQLLVDGMSFNIIETKKNYLQCIQHAIDSVLPERDRFEIEKFIGGNKLSVSPVVEGTINVVAKSLGFSASLQFIERCAVLWDVFSTSNHKVVALIGDPGCGKSAVLNTVQKCLIRTGESLQPPFLNTPNSVWRHHAVVIYRAVNRWWRWKNRRRSSRSSFFSPNLTTHAFIPVESSTAGLQVSNCVIYSASLSTSHLIGDFNTKGQWLDGLFSRKIRTLNYSNYAGDSIYCIRIVGPMGSAIEALFSNSYFHNSLSMYPALHAFNSRLVLPSTEVLSIPDGVIVVFETSDTSAASPSMLFSTPQVFLTIDMEFCINRLLVAWVRSLSHWLAKYPPWVSLLDEIKNLFFKQGFVSALIEIGRLLQQDMTVLVNSMVSTFLRILEELLVQCHDIALEECSYINDQDFDDTSDSEDDWPSAEHGQEKHQNQSELESYEIRPRAMFLSAKQRNLLALRVRYSIIYASIWGFGGLVNGSERRKLFNIATYDLFRNVFGPSLDIPIDYSLFDVVLTLKEPGLHFALRVDPILGMFPPNPIDSDTFVQCRSHLDSGYLHFDTPMQISLRKASKYAMLAGASVFFIGVSGNGKTRLITDMLKEMGHHCPSSQNMRADIVENITDLIRGTRISGIPFALQTLRNVMNGLYSIRSIRDDEFKVEESWKTLREGLKNLWKINPKSHFQNKTVFSSSTSILYCNTADQVAYF